MRKLIIEVLFIFCCLATSALAQPIPEPRTLPNIESCTSFRWTDINKRSPGYECRDASNRIGTVRGEIDYNYILENRCAHKVAANIASKRRRYVNDKVETIISSDGGPFLDPGQSRKRTTGCFIPGTIEMFYCFEYRAYFPENPAQGITNPPCLSASYDVEEGNENYKYPHSAPGWFDKQGNLKDKAKGIVRRLVVIFAEQ